MLIAIEPQFVDKIAHNEWRSPPVNGKANADAFISSKVIVPLTIGHGLGNGDKTLASGLCQPFSNIAGISGAREIEYHRNEGYLPIMVTWGRLESSPGLEPGSPSGTDMQRWR